MRSTFLILFLIISSIIGLSAGVYLYPKPAPEPVMTRSDNSSAYKDEWSAIDKINLNKYPKSAFEKIDSLYQRAVKEQNIEQQIKSLIYLMSVQTWMVEDSDQKVFDMVRENIRLASFPASAILQSIQAEMYWSYYQNHYYSEAKRSETINFKLDNIDTWDMKTVAKAAISEFKDSLERENELMGILVANYPVLVGSGNDYGKIARPTLYDLLAHRALTRYDEGQNGFSVLLDNYRFSDPMLLAPASDFTDWQITPADTTSGKYLSLILYQKLIRSHMKDKDPAALVFADLERLTFVRRYMTGKDIAAEYEKTLIAGENQYFGQPVSTHYTFYRATLIQQGIVYTDPETGETTTGRNNVIALEMCNNASEAFPASYGGLACAELAKSIIDPDVNFSMENVVLPGMAIKLTLSLRNINTLKLRVYKVPTLSGNRYYYGENDIDYYEENDVLSKLLKTKPVYEASYPGHNEGDYNAHSFDVDVVAQPIGRYLLIVSDNFNRDLYVQHLKLKEFSCSNLAAVVQNNMQIFTDEYTGNILQVCNRTTGNAISQARVSGYKYYNHDQKPGKIKAIRTAYSDKNGKAIIKYLNRYDIDYFILSKGADSLYVLADYILRGSYDQHQYITQTVLLFTDRSIYRPGQTIYCKGIMYESDGGKYHKLLTEQKVYLTFRDRNYQTITTQNLTTNEFGAVDCTFTAPGGVLLGSMTIESRTGSSIAIRVEEYKRPKFEVKIDKPKETFKMEQKVTVTGKAQAFAGFPIDGADVTYTIKRSPQYAYWYWWWDYPVQGDAQVLETGNLVSDKQGNFTITFTATGDDKYTHNEGMYFNYEIKATVTDINGETHDGTLNLSIGATELILDPIIDKFVPLSDSPLSIKLKSTNLSGEKIAVRGKITISLLQTLDHIQRSKNQSQWGGNGSEGSNDRNYMTREEFLKHFPTDAYGTENRIDSWKVLRLMYSDEFDTEINDTLKIDDFRDWKPGMYRIEAVSTFKGQEIKVYRYFTVFDVQSKKLPYIAADLYIPVKTICQPGETAQILVGSSYTNVVMRFEVEKQHKIVDSLIIVLNNRQRVFSIPVLETDRGGFYVHISYWRDNRFYMHSQLIDVAWKNKQLEFEYMTFRDKLLPGQDEEWRLKLKDYTGGAASAELLASMYDASLDALQMHKWSANIYNTISMSGGWRTATPTYRSYGTGSHQRYYTNYPYVMYSYLQTFGKDIRWNRRYSGGYGGAIYDRAISKEMSLQAGAFDSLGELHVRGGRADEMNFTTDGLSVSDPVGGGSAMVIDEIESGISTNAPQPEPDLSQIAARTNMQETAFFYPTLRTDENGEVSIAFTVPEALTRWKFQALALTKDLKIGLTENFTVTQKTLMVIPNLPRFFREGDKITISAKISALEETEQTGQCRMYLTDALSDLPVDKLFKLNSAQKTFSVKPGESTVLEWTIEIPFGISAVNCKVVAQAGDFSDGEETTLPILTNRMLVTESLPLPVRGKSTKAFVFEKLLHSKDSNTLTNHKLTLEFTSNPSWYAIQALPYMIDYPYGCNEQIFSRFYGNSLATHIANSNPRIKKVFEAWKNIPDSAALMSNLEKNQELKSVVLEETPWVMDAKNEAQSKQRIGLLLDLNTMRNKLDSSLSLLKQNQMSNGAWSWFVGMPDSWWVTQYIVEGLGHLKKLGVITTGDNDINQMVSKALRYLDMKILEDYNYIMAHSNPENDHLGYLEMHYLYARSFFPDNKISQDVKVAVDYFRGQAAKYWGNKSLYGQALLALAEHRNGNELLPGKIIKSFNERAFQNEELGMWWKENTSGWYWYQAPIETQALLIEAYNDITKDTVALDELRTWLLKQKQTTNWKTTKATAEACYALLLTGTEWLNADQQAEIVVGGKTIDPSKLDGASVEAGTGYFKTSWSGNDITPQQANISVTNPNPGPAWGAMYWQYFENLDKITPANTPLKLKKQLFIERISAKGTVIEPISDKAVLQIGDKVIVRIELRTDRDMEYVHMKDMRSAGFEPINVLSRYKWQDGLGYYEATGDAATNFFIEYLAKGTYIFEYPLRVNNKGDFSNAVTSIQCMYAPEFSAHSEGIRVEVK